MKSLLRLGLIVLAAMSVGRAQNLDIYFIDVEGGAATLIVTPERQSVLIDDGWRRDDGRDAKRIVQVLKEQAGLSQIDFLVITHFHRDHYGSTQRLAQLVPIKNFLDRGPIAGLREDPQFQLLYTEYMMANKGDRQTVVPGDKIPLQQGKEPVEITCVASRGSVFHIKGPANSECSQLKANKRIMPDENWASAAFLLQFGRFKLFHGADLTWNIEGELVCPENGLGHVDAYVVDHHGLKVSNNPVLLKSLAPTVAIMENGEEKGCDPEVVTLLKSLPGLKDLYQLHKNLKNRPEGNTAEESIANLTPEASCEGHWLKLEVDLAASSFHVTNSRNQLTKSYPIQ